LEAVDAMQEHWEQDYEDERGHYLEQREEHFRDEEFDEADERDLEAMREVRHRTVYSDRREADVVMSSTLGQIRVSRIRHEFRSLAHNRVSCRFGFPVLSKPARRECREHVCPS
jgi:hypothetical protein